MTRMEIRRVMEQEVKMFFNTVGRENDNNGLYLYRARYYSFLFQRFISEDPTGFSGGLNLYAYVFRSPR